MADEERKAKLEASRSQAMAESFDVAKKEKYGRKHGVFTMATTNALGDTNKFPKTTHPRDADTGKPITDPPNFFTKPGKKGKDDEVYIGANKKDFKKHTGDVNKEIYEAKSSYLATGCTYDQSVLKHIGKRTFVKNGYEAIGGHETDFRPAKQMTHAKKTTLASYEYKPEGPPVRKKKILEEDGMKQIITENPNIKTNPMKKGVVHGKVGKPEMGPNFDPARTAGNQYIESDYNIEKKILRDELAAHQAAMEALGAPQAFKPLANQVKGDAKKYYFGTFNNPKNVIGPIGDKVLPPKPVPPPPLNIHEEDPKWKPYGTNTAKKNQPLVHATLDKFPGYNKGAILVTKRRPPPADDEPPPFKRGYGGTYNCVTSIATNTRNLKASYPTFFRK